MAPEIEKPAPTTVAAETAIGNAPEAAKATDCVAVVFTGTLPKAMLVALMVSPTAPTFNCRAKLCEIPPAVAMRATDWAVLTAETVTVKLALLRPTGTVTVAGTVTALLLLDRLTANPPFGAAAFSVAVQRSVPAPVIDPMAQLSALSTGTPMPLRLTNVDDPVEELLAKIREPVAVPAIVGSNCTLRVVVWPGFSVTGNPPPDAENPFPNTPTVLTVTGAVPVEDKVSD